MAENDLPPSTPGPEVVKGAMKAFRKRLKANRLDDESGKIAGPMSSGRTSGIFAITPPSQFSQEVWEELVKQGKLKYDGYGLYKLGDGA